MRDDVCFRYVWFEGRGAVSKLVGKCEYTVVEVNEELASNVIRRDDQKDIRGDNARHKDIVHVAIATEDISSSKYHRIIEDLPFSFLEISKSVRPPHLMPRTCHSPDSGCC